MTTIANEKPRLWCWFLKEHTTRRCRAHTVLGITLAWISTLLRIIYITFFTAVAFCGRTVLLFVLADKVTPKVADGRSGAAGVGLGWLSSKERGKRRQRGPSRSHKSVLGGLEGQRSGKHLLWPEGTLQRPGETCCRGVCCFSFPSVWVDLYPGRGAGQRGSITVGVGRHTRSSRRAVITSVSLGCRVAISACALISHQTTAGGERRGRGWDGSKRGFKEKDVLTKCFFHPFL